MNASRMFICSLALCASVAQARTIGAEEWVGDPPPYVGALTRAQVQADLDLWIRSGMSSVAYSEGFDPGSERVRQPLAAYHRLSQGTAVAAGSQDKDFIIHQEAQATAP